jgi:hypothetical protein
MSGRATGVSFSFDKEDPFSFNTEMINEEKLMQNLNHSLFFDLYNYTLDQLREAYEEFKESLNYKILKEDILRQEQLYEVMIEGGFIIDS